MSVILAGIELSHCQLAQKNGLQELNAKVSPEGALGISQPESGPQAGRYQGLAQTLGSKRQFHMVLDLAYVGQKSYRVFVRFSPGDEESMEFSSMFFVQGSLDKNRVIFKSSNSKDLWGFIEDNQDQSAKGGFYSATGKQLVAFNLNRSSLQKTEKTIDSGLSGYYQAKSCAAHLKGLYLESYRESRDSPLDQSPLRISGRLVQNDSKLCFGKAACVAESYTSGFFDPFSGTLMLDGTTQKRTCVFKKNVISCDIPCQFERTKDANLLAVSPDKNNVLGIATDLEQKSLGVFKKMTKIDLPANQIAGQTNQYDGQYYGYIFHESLGTYQLFALNFESKDAKPPQGPLMVPMGSLYFGEGDSSEFIAYSFLPVPVPNGHDVRIFEGRGDGVLVVREWTPDRLVGDWYSKSFGYVGPLILYRGIVPKLSQDATLIQPVSASYLGGNWNLELTASPEISDYGTAFYPLRIYGFAKEEIVHSKRRIVEQGTYDFYTGQILLRLDDHRSIVGRLQEDGIFLYWPPNPRVGTDLEQGKSIQFKKFGVYPEPRALNLNLKNQS